MTKQIALTRGKVALVDDNVYMSVAGYTWYARPARGGHAYYAYGTVDGKLVAMHRFIVDAESGEVVDHVNHDGLDNRCQNLRRCTLTQNQGNRRVQPHSSRYKGVSKRSDCAGWTATIRVNKKTRHLGTFQREEDAARAYDMAAHAHFGEFALTNGIE